MVLVDGAADDSATLARYFTPTKRDIEGTDIVLSSLPSPGLLGPKVTVESLKKEVASGKFTKAEFLLEKLDLCSLDSVLTVVLQPTCAVAVCGELEMLSNKNLPKAHIVQMHSLIHQPWEMTRARLSAANDQVEKDVMLVKAAGVLASKALTHKKFPLARQILMAVNPSLRPTSIQHFPVLVGSWHHLCDMLVVFIANDPDDFVTTRMLEKITNPVTAPKSIAGLFQHFSIDRQWFVSMIKALLSYKEDALEEFMLPIVRLVDRSDMPVLKEGIATKEMQLKFARYFYAGESVTKVAWKKMTPRN